MTSEEVKHCIDCKWYEETRGVCTSQKSLTPDLITGEVVTFPVFAVCARLFETHCGPKRKYFEPKNGVY